MIISTAPITREAFESGTGWALKPEGACRGDVCVPLPAGAVTSVAADPGAGGPALVDVGIVAARLGMPIVADDETGIRAVGPASFGGRALATAAAPDLVLPDLDGNPFRLSSLLGQKVVLVSWAPY
jgi:hypothetical protein